MYDVSNLPILKTLPTDGSPPIYATNKLDVESVTQIVSKTDVFQGDEKKEAIIEKPKNFINCFQNDNGLCTQLHNQLQSAFEGYFRGTVVETSLFRTVDQAVSSLIECFGNLGFDPKEITPEIIEDVYENCRSDIVSGAAVASYQEGKQVAQQTATVSGCWFYYNADYYYQAEGLINRLHDHMEKLAVKYGCEPLELARDFHDGDERNQFYGSYNSYINHQARQVSGSMIDEKMIPPEDFRLFFDPNGTGVREFSPSMGFASSMESTFDGAVFIQYKDWNFSHRVPIRMDFTRFPISVNLMDVIKSSQKPYPQKISSFLSNFDFFATNIGKLYTDVHKRNY